MEFHPETNQQSEEVLQRLQHIIDIYCSLYCCKTADRRAFNYLFDEIITTIATIFKEARFYRYGSQVTNVATIDSDMDLFVELQDHTEINQKRRALKRISGLLENYGFNVNRTLLAKVPVIGICKYGMSTDISICNNRGLQNSLLINRYMTITGNESFKRALIAIKAVLSVYGINSPIEGSFSSYSINVLAINVALCLNFIPNLQQGSKDANPEFVTDTNCDSYAGKYISSRNALDFIANNPQNLSANLFYEFFSYYANFKLAKYVVQINSNRLIKRKETMDQPVVVLDPFDSAINLTKQVTNAVRNKFKELCFLMENNPLACIDLLKIDENMLQNQIAIDAIPFSEKSYYEIVDELERSFNFQHKKACDLVNEWLKVQNSVYCKLPRAWIASQNFKLQFCEFINSFANTNINSEHIKVIHNHIVFIHPVTADVSLEICAYYNKLDKTHPLLQFRERWNMSDDLANLSFFSCNIWPSKKAMNI